MRADGLKLQHGRFRLVISNFFFYSRRVVIHWHGLHREVGESPSLEGFKKHGDVALWDMFYWAWWW